MSTTRTITVFSTKGKSKVKIETAATTWSELRGLVEAEGYDVESLHATENVNRTNLANADSILPAMAFTLFLRPKKTKSGSCGNCDIRIDEIEEMSFRALRGLVNEPNIKAYLSGISTNWTQLSTEDLRDGIIAFYLTLEDEDEDEDSYDEDYYGRDEDEDEDEGVVPSTSEKAYGIKADLLMIAATLGTGSTVNASFLAAAVHSAIVELDSIIADVTALEVDNAELEALMQEANDIESKSYNICG
jgi:hypothetical protein